MFFCKDEELMDWANENRHKIVSYAVKDKSVIAVRTRKNEVVLEGGTIRAFDTTQEAVTFMESLVE